MRIISGKARGTKLYTLEGNITRPTLDRVKESVFNIIQNNIIESVFVDLFSGSGAIGLEAASRGAKKVILCEKDKNAANVIKKNIEKTHLNENTILYNMNYEKMIEKLNEKIDIIYIDPPYKTDLAYESLKKMIELELITNDTLIIVETDEEERIFCTAVSIPVKALSIWFVVLSFSFHRDFISVLFSDASS